MNGYGFSIWYVPEDYKNVMKVYKMEHIPHITYKTFIQTLEEATILYNQLPKYETVYFYHRKIFDFGDCDTHPLAGCGFSVENHGILEDVKSPHMTIKYFKTPYDRKDMKDYLSSTYHYDSPSGGIKCFKAISDCSGLVWSSWQLLS